MSTPPFDPADPPVPELEVDEDVPPRPEEEIADAGREEQDDAPGAQGGGRGGAATRP